MCRERKAWPARDGGVRSVSKNLDFVLKTLKGLRQLVLWALKPIQPGGTLFKKKDPISWSWEGAV